MNPQIKQAWIDALTSGAYEQGYNQLRLRDSYCCLGVLCELAEMEWVCESNGYRHEAISYGKHIHEAEELVLPKSVMAWAELEESSPSVKDSNLSDINDSGKSFEQIAQLIHEHL